MDILRTVVTLMILGGMTTAICSLPYPWQKQEVTPRKAFGLIAGTALCIAGWAVAFTQSM